MKIEQNQAANIASQANSRVDKAKARKEAPRGNGKNVGAGVDVQLSPQGRRRAEMQLKAHQIASNTSPVREDKIAEIKAKIAAGTYKVDAGNIADGMLREAVRDELALKEFA